MRKISKLSLVAALAVAGFSTANAKPLEEAIKDVDVSGSVVYRYNDYSNKALSIPTDPGSGKKGSSVNNNYKVGLNLSSKVNDFAKFNSRFLVAGANSGLASLSTQDKADLNPSATLSHAYFALTSIKNTTINVGKQGLATPWTTAIDPAGNDYTGTGALALSTWGPVTVALGYFNQTNLNAATDASIEIVNTDPTPKPGDLLTGSKKIVDIDDGLKGTEDIIVTGIIGKAGPIDIDLWYSKMKHELNTYTLGVGGNFGSKASNFGFDARFVNLKFQDDNEKNTLMKLALMGKVGIVNAKIAYGKSGDKSLGLTAFDNSAKTTMEGWNTNINGKRNAKYIQTTLGVDIISNLNLSANYNTLKYDVEDEYTDNKHKFKEKEIYAQLTYKMSKNLSTLIRYGKYNKDDEFSGKTKINDDKRGRLQVAYTF